MLRFLRRLHRGREGQMVLEFVLVMPLIILLLFIAVDFSLSLRDWVMVANATREGARYGALGGPIGPAQITNRVVVASDGLVQPAEVQVVYLNSNGSLVTGDRGDSVVVRTTHARPFHFLPFFFLISPSFTMSTCSDMRLEIGVSPAPGGIAC